MKWKIRQLLRSLILIAVLSGHPSFASDAQALSPESLRQHLLETIGNIPWTPSKGYQLSGKYVLKGTSEETSYRATYTRLPNRWVVDFAQEDRTRNMRFAFTESKAWISSPEVTMDIDPHRLPYSACYDFASLYADLIGILDKGKTDPLFQMEILGSDVYVRGKVQSGAEAMFALNTVGYFLRKVAINAGAAMTSVWVFASIDPAGSGSLIEVPGPSQEFEVWFSDPVDAGGYRYARRTDFVDRGIVVGSFFLEKGSSVENPEAFFSRPPASPWALSADFHPGADPNRQLFYQSDDDLPAFQARLKTGPWLEWVGANRALAAWAAVALWIGALIPHPPSFGAFLTGVGIAFLGFVLIRNRRWRQFGQKLSWKPVVVWGLVCFFALLVEFASLQLHAAGSRSLLALQSAIRYRITGHTFHAWNADRLLRGPATEAPAESIESLGQACQAYALTYDLIRRSRPQERRLAIERDLFSFAKPLYGAMQGWRSNTEVASVAYAGLGMVGLAIGDDPFVNTARDGIQRSFADQLEVGLHRAGPGSGSSALDSAANLLFALRQTGRGDYYTNPSFQQYVLTSLELLSPEGTLPLFGDTDLTRSRRASAFFLKVANLVPEELGRQCVAAHERYWNHGRYAYTGISRIILDSLQADIYFYENPYLLFQYTRAQSPAPLPKSSAVLGNRQAAILRTGSSAESLYLALNALGSGISTTAHRDILTFDLYAYQGLLLHGPGFPGRKDARYMDTLQTAAANSVTLNDASQSSTQCSGVAASLLNQPVFDYVRVLADKTYDYGQVQRDAILVRPDKDHSGYFFLIDDISTTDPETKAAWYLHGNGELAASIDQILRWSCSPFSPDRGGSAKITLAAYPLGMSGKMRSQAGTLYSETSFLNEKSDAAILEWTGSKRFCTILSPLKSGQADPKMESLIEGKAGHVGSTDWISLGDLSVPRSAGPLNHVSEYTAIRTRGDSFPAILMVNGLQVQVGPHVIQSDKPVTLSIDGLSGGLLTMRPDITITFRSPTIKSGDRFLVDGQALTASVQGELSFKLEQTGEHTLRKSN